jgi:peptide/nickel transport system permease protein
MRRAVSLPVPWDVAGKYSTGLKTIARGTWRLIKEKPLGAVGAVIVLVLLCCAIFASWIATHPYDQANVRYRLKPPSAQFYLGTDNLGRDIFSRMIYGAQISVTVGFGAVAIGTLLATMIGVGSGHFGGKFDVLLQRVVDAWMAFPFLVVLLSTPPHKRGVEMTVS